MAEQHWDEKQFCDDYANTWEIALDQVHYGWLAPGERDLQLIDLDLVNANVLDIGCGMGENLIALARQGANGYGIDISAHMLERARQNIAPWTRDIAPIHLQQQDMRRTDFFPGIQFDLILSVYSLEYLDSVQELRDLCYNLYRRLKPGGLFIFCFSHQLQHVRHNMLANRSVKTGDDPFATLIYSFRDVVSALTDTGFVLERVVEQGTRNPSRLSYEEAVHFPYHFHKGRNPCMPQFDKWSNRVPHTVIYKARKLSGSERDTGRQIPFPQGPGKILLWGEQRRVTESYPIRLPEGEWLAHRLAARDSVVGVCEVLHLEVTEADLAEGGDLVLEVNLDGSPASVSVPANSAQAFLHRALEERGLGSVYARSLFRSAGEWESGLYIKRLEPVHGAFHALFPQQQTGLLVFINGEEPAHGTIGLEDISIHPGDHLQLVYVATRWGKAWRPRKKPDQQLALF